MRKLLLLVLGFFGFVFVLFLGVTFIVVFTPSPAKWFLDSLNNPAKGTTVQYESVEGNLLSGFALKSLKVESPQIKLSLPTANFQYDLKESRAQGALIVSDVTCVDCAVDVLDPLFFIKESKVKDPEGKAPAPEKR